MDDPSWSRWRRRGRLRCALVGLTLVASACSSTDTETTEEATTSTVAATTSTASPTTEATSTEATSAEATSAEASEDDDGTGAASTDAPPTGTLTIVFRVSGETSVDDAAAGLATRIADLGVDDVSTSVDGSTITVGIGGLTEADAAGFRIGALDDGSGLQAVPVLSLEPDDTADSGRRATDANGLEYVLGVGVSLAGEVAASARVLETGPVIVLALTETGLETFNVAAGWCFNRTVECPSAQLALVTDGLVLTAPTVQFPSFDVPELFASGQFTIEEATELAASINSAAILDVDEVSRSFEAG